MVEGERGDGGWGLGNPPIQKGGVSLERDSFGGALADICRCLNFN